VAERGTVFRTDGNEFEGAVFDFWSDEEVLVCLRQTKTTLEVEFGGEFFAKLLLNARAKIEMRARFGFLRLG
jgi:hypothetical protein